MGLVQVQKSMGEGGQGRHIALLLSPGEEEPEPLPFHHLGGADKALQDLPGLLPQLGPYPLPHPGDLRSLLG